MPRQFKLLSQHYIDDRLLEAGKVIGEGTDVPFLHPDGTPRPPSNEMEGLDEAAQAEVEAVLRRGFIPIESLPMTMEPVDVGPIPTEAPADTPVFPKGGKK